MKYPKEDIDKSTAYELLCKLLDSTDEAFVRDNFEHQREVFDSFSDVEKVVHITNVFEFEYYNGGLLQFFMNSSGQFAEDAIVAFRLIGAAKTAAVIEKALAVLATHGVSPTFLNQRLQDVAEEYKITTQRDIYDDEILSQDFSLVTDELRSFYPTEVKGGIDFLLERYIDSQRNELTEE